MTSQRPSYQPPTTVKQWPGAVSYIPRVSPPLEDPPPATSLPALPSPPRAHAFAATYALTTHIIPAAYPRTFPNILARPVPADLDTRPSAERKKIMATAAAEVQALRNAHERGVLEGPRGDEGFWIAVNRYKRRDVRESQPKGLTLLCTHAIGFCKEMWEPTLKVLLARLEANPNAPRVDEIWSFDLMSHGDSALLNAGRLPAICDNIDSGRDLLHFLLHYLPDTCTSDPLPTHLPRLSDTTAQTRKGDGISSRTLVGLAHSVGGLAACVHDYLVFASDADTNVSIFASLTHPALFSSIILVDPPIGPSYGLTPEESNAHLLPIVRGTLGRRAYWPSMDAARAYLASHPAYKRWAPDALATYIAAAVAPAPGGGVALKCPPEQEAATWELRTSFDVWARLPALDARVRMFWVMPRVESMFGLPQKVARELVWRREARAGNVVVNAGHLIPMENPGELGVVVGEFLEEQYGARGGKRRTVAQARL